MAVAVCTDGLSLAAAVVAAIAAVVAAHFSWRTVGEARGARREERRARVTDLVGELAATRLKLFQSGTPDEHERTTLAARWPRKT